MAIKTCTGTTGQAYLHVQARLSQQATITASGLDAPLLTNVTGAADGTYSITLWAALDLTPTGTFYTVTEFLGATDNTFNVQVPNSAGPFVMTNILVGTPTASPTPNHVSTLTVDGGVGSPTITSGDIAARSLTVSTGNGPYVAITTPAAVVGPGSVIIAGPDPWWDAAANGVLCDGVTDQITQLQALVDKVAATTGGSRRIWLPGKVAISTPLLLKTAAYSGLQFRSPDRARGGLVQLTNNTPIIQTSVDSIHEVVIEDTLLTWANVQTTAHTNSYAISWNATGGGGNGWAYWTLRRLAIVNPYVGLGIQGTGLNPVWSALWDDIRFTHCAHRLIDMTSPTASGMPVNTWRKIVHLSGGAAVGDAAAIQTSACEVECDGLDLEDWGDTRLITANGGSPVSYRNIHIERWQGANAGSAFSANNNGPMLLSDVWVAGTPNATAGAINLFSADTADALLSVERVKTYNLTITTPANWKTVNGVAGSQLWLRNLVRQGGTVVPILSAGDATTLAAIVLYDNNFGSLLQVGAGAGAGLDTNVVGTLNIGTTNANLINLNTLTQSLYGMRSLGAAFWDSTGATAHSWRSSAGSVIGMTLSAAGLLNLPLAAATASGLQVNGGSTIRSGAGVPSNAIGADGDYWLRTDGGGAGATHLYYRNAAAYIGIA